MSSALNDIRGKTDQQPNVLIYFYVRFGSDFFLYILISWNFLSFLFLIEQMSPSSVRTKLNQKGTMHNDITLFYFKSNLYVIFPTEFVWDTSFWLVPNMCYRVALTISMLWGNEHGAKIIVIIQCLTPFLINIFSR